MVSLSAEEDDDDGICSLILCATITNLWIIHYSYNSQSHVAYNERTVQIELEDFLKPSLWELNLLLLLSMSSEWSLFYILSRMICAEKVSV